MAMTRCKLSRAEYSDDENNNYEPMNHTAKKVSTASEEPHYPLSMLLSGIFAMACMVYSLYTTHELVLFLSGNANGILVQTEPYNSDVSTTILRDLGLLLVFVLQHVVMASSCYKNFIAHVVPQHLHRSLYVLFTGVAVQVLTRYWENIMSSKHLFLWDLSTSSAFVLVCQILHLLAWIHTFAVVFMLDFPEFMGVKQVYYEMNNFGCPLQAKTYAAQRLFGHFRHATVTGMMIVFWVVPCLTLDRLLLASVFTLFLFSTKIDREDALYVSRMYTMKKAAFQHRK